MSATKRKVFFKLHDEGRNESILRKDDVESRFLRLGSRIDHPRSDFGGGVSQSNVGFDAHRINLGRRVFLGRLSISFEKRVSVVSRTLSCSEKVGYLRYRFLVLLLRLGSSRRRRRNDLVVGVAFNEPRVILRTENGRFGRQRNRCHQHQRNLDDQHCETRGSADGNKIRKWTFK